MIEVTSQTAFEFTSGDVVARVIVDEGNVITEGVIRVRDHGVVMTPADLSRLAEAFTHLRVRLASEGVTA